MKTTDLIGTALDWAVAKCMGGIWEDGSMPFWPIWPDTNTKSSPSTDWAQGGPIIERECICTYASGGGAVRPKKPTHWVAEILEVDGIRDEQGPTPLVAAMRVFVASRLGDEIDLPEELK